MTIETFFKEHLEVSNKKLMKYDQDLQSCKRQLTAVKLRLSALEFQMLAMKTIYHDIMELRRIVSYLHPNIKAKSSPGSATSVRGYGKSIGHGSGKSRTMPGSNNLIMVPLLNASVRPSVLLDNAPLKGTRVVTVWDAGYCLYRNTECTP